MATRDVNFYNFLIEAFRHKLSPAGKTDSYYSNGRYSLPYNGQSGIFYFARKYLPYTYNNRHPLTKADLKKDLETNLEYAKEVIYQLDNHKDAELEKYTKAETISESDAFHKEIEDAVTEHLKEVQKNPETHKFAGEEYKTSSGESGLKKLFNKKEANIQPATDKAERIKKQTQEQTPTPGRMVQGLQDFAILKRPVPTIRRPKLETPSVAKDVAVQGEIAAKKLVTRAPEFIAPFFKDIFAKGGSSFLSTGGNVLSSGATYSFLNFSNSPSGFIGGFGSRVGGGLITGTGKKAILVIILILLFLVFLIAFFFNAPKIPGINTSKDEPSPDTQKQLVIEKTGPEKVPNDSQIKYQLNVTYKGSGRATNVEIKDPLPTDAQGNTIATFVSASHDGKLVLDKIVTWQIPEILPGNSVTLELKILPTSQDVWIANQANATYTNTNTTSTTGGGSLTNCTFDAHNKQNLAIKSSALASMIEAAAKKIGIPSSILAGMVMHESPDLLTMPDLTPDVANTHAAIGNNYYYYVSQANDGVNRNTNAIGISQISTGQTPIVSTGTIVDHCKAFVGNGILKRAAEKLGKKIQDPAGDNGVSYYCVDDLGERIRRLCQTDRVEKRVTYYQPDKTPDDSYINLCRLEDNLAIGGEFLLSTLGSGSWENESQFKEAIRGYYGGCAYPGGDYCNEVYKGYQSCRPQSTNTLIQNNQATSNTPTSNSIELPKPMNLTMRSTGKNIILSWDPVDGARMYSIYYSNTTKSGFAGDIYVKAKDPNSSPPTSTTIKDSSFNIGDRYRVNISSCLELDTTCGRSFNPKSFIMGNTA